MPTYEYHCDSCARNFDVVQGFHDDPLEVCPTCGSPVRKVFGSVGIVFKGSGFYKTDSRTTTAKGADGSSKAGGDTQTPDHSGSDGGASESGSGTGTTPASAPKGDSPSPASPSPSSSGNGATPKVKESAKT